MCVEKMLVQNYSPKLTVTKSPLKMLVGKHLYSEITFHTLKTLRRKSPSNRSVIYSCTPQRSSLRRSWYYIIRRRDGARETERKRVREVTEKGRERERERERQREREKKSDRVLGDWKGEKNIVVLLFRGLLSPWGFVAEGFLSQVDFVGGALVGGEGSYLYPEKIIMCIYVCCGFQILRRHIQCGLTFCDARWRVRKEFKKWRKIVWRHLLMALWTQILYFFLLSSDNHLLPL